MKQSKMFISVPRSTQPLQCAVSQAILWFSGLNTKCRCLHSDAEGLAPGSVEDSTWGDKLGWLQQDPGASPSGHVSQDTTNSALDKVCWLGALKVAQ